MKEKQLWLLKAIDVNHSDEVLVIASTQEEAEERWDDLFGDSDYLGKVVKVVDSIDNHKIFVQEKDEVQRLKNKIRGLEDSLGIYKEENDNYEKSSHIENFMYEMNVNEKGEIPCLIKANGVEHTLGITERDARSFVRIFQMSKMK